MTNPWTNHVLAYQAANRGMSYKDAMRLSRPSYYESRGLPVPAVKARKPRAAPKARKSGPRAKLAPALHSCAGLREDPCSVAPNCYWKPTTQTCATRSGKQITQRMQGAERKAMLAQMRERVPQERDF